LPMYVWVWHAIVLSRVRRAEVRGLWRVAATLLPSAVCLRGYTFITFSVNMAGSHNRQALLSRGSDPRFEPIESLLCILPCVAVAPILLKNSQAPITRTSLHPLLPHRGQHETGRHGKCFMYRNECANGSTTSDQYCNSDAH